MIRAPVPDHDSTGAVVAFRDHPFEKLIVDGVVLHHDGKLLLLRIEGGAFGHGPALENAVELEAQVPMEARGVVFVDDEAKRLVRRDAFLS